MDNPIRRAICMDAEGYDNELILGKEYDIRDDDRLTDFVNVYITSTHYTTCYAYRFKDMEEVGNVWSTP